MIDLVDEIVDLFNRALKKADSRSRRELEAWRVSTARNTNEKVLLFSRVGRLVLDPEIPDEQLRQRIFEEVVPRDRFEVAVEETTCALEGIDGASFGDYKSSGVVHSKKDGIKELSVLPER